MVAFAAAAAAGSMLCSTRVRAADAPQTVNLNANDLTLQTSYTPAAQPTAASDVEFVNSTYSSTTFTNGTVSTAGTTLTFGTLDDLNTSQSLSITNNNTAASSIEFMGGGDSLSGSILDVIYVATGGSLTLQSGSGPLDILLAPITGSTTAGNVDVNGSLSISAPIIFNAPAARTITFIGSGSSTITGGISDGSGKTDAIAVNSGIVTLGGVNSQTGGTFVQGGTLNLSGSLTGGSAVTVSSGTFNEGGSGIITGAASLKVVGGLATISGSNSYTGGTSVGGGSLLSGGALKLDFSATNAPASNIISASSALTLDSTLGVTFTSGSSASSQTFSGTTINTGFAAQILVDQNGNTNSASGIALKGIARNAGATVDFILPTAGSITTTSDSGTFLTGTNNILTDNRAAFATVGGTTWATNTTAGTIGALAANAYQVDNFATGGDTDVEMSDSPTSAFTVNTLRFSTSGTTLTLNATGPSTISTGGILVTSGTSGSVITGSGSAGIQSAAADNAEVIIHDYGNLTIDVPILGGASTALTITGNGVTTLNSTNTNGGANYLLNGTLAFGSAAALGGGTLAIGGGSSIGLDNASGSPLTLTTHNAITIASSYLTFAGSNDLNMGSGSVSLNVSTQTFTLNGNHVLTFGGEFFDGVTANQSSTVNNGTGAGANTALTVNGYALSGGSNNGRVDVINGSANVNFNGPIINGGTSTSGIAYSGSGILTFSGTNTYTGATTVTGGRLVLNGTHTGTGIAGYAIGDGVNAAALGGVGTTSAAVTINANATIEPGTAVATVGSLSIGALGGAGKFVADVNFNNSTSGTGGSEDEILIPSGTGSVNISSMSLSLNLINVPSTPLTGAVSFILIDNAGSGALTTNGASGSFASITSSNGSVGYTLSAVNADGGATANDLQITFTAAPEPSSIALIGATSTGFLIRRRRRTIKHCTSIPG